MSASGLAFPLLGKLRGTLRYVVGIRRVILFVKVVLGAGTDCACSEVEGLGTLLTLLSRLRIVYLGRPRLLPAV